VCTDFTAELADISVGGAYPLEGWSTVIVRTKAGEDFFFRAVEEGILNVQPIEDHPTVYERVGRAAMQKRTAGLRRGGELEKTYGFTFVSAIPLRETESLTRVKVRDIMTRNVSTVSKDMTIDKLLDVMVKDNHVGYPVTNQEGDLVGEVTIEEASLVDRKKRQQTRVEEVMRKKLVTGFPEETGLDAFKKMSKNERGRMVIIDPANERKLLGIVSKTDLIEWLLKNPEPA
jgi:CBS domain-containing protein